MNETLHLLTTATQEYNLGNLDSAKAYAKQAVALLDNTVSYDYLNAVTLLQSIANRQHDLITYETYETSVCECMQRLMGNSAQSYYAVHLLDSCECYLNAGDIANAQWRLEKGITILQEENGFCPLISFLHAYFNARLHFHMNQYYQCLHECLSANDFWMVEVLIPDNATAFLQSYAANETLITNLACSNLILLSCAYGKINNSEEGIALLTALAKEPPEDYYLRTSMDLILAELYTKAGKLPEARSIYQKYRGLNPTQYPDLYASLATLSIVLENCDTNNSHFLFTAQNDGQLPASICYSRDAFQILVYNHGLSLIQRKQYNEALTLYHRLGDRGLSLTLFLLAQTENFAAIPDCKKRADRYFDNEVRSLFLYYDEKLVYNHLSLLEYHFSLCMDAYILCYEALGRQVMPPESIYDFLLNTKYISMEASFLSRHTQTLEVLNNRKPMTNDEIRSRLSDEELLLEYCITRTVTESFYCVFLVSGQQVHCIRLCEKETIDDLLTKWHSLLLRTASASLAENKLLMPELLETESKLRRLLYRPMKDYIADTCVRHLIIAPAGSLLQFPFSQLAVSSSSFLGDRYEITYLNTGKELLTNAPLSDNSLDSALIIGNPALQEYPPLPYAEHEAHIAAEYLHTDCYTGKTATLSLLEPCFHKAPSLVHLATHGIFCNPVIDSASPDWNAAFSTMENSGLLLAGNELLSCNLISAMDFSGTSLTVLSACETGQGIFHAAEGVYGLRRAFRLAGCHAMIVSLWQIDDRSGCFFMNAFYQNLTHMRGNSKYAFRCAIDALRSYEENNTHPFAHPYYWAGYLYIE